MDMRKMRMQVLKKKEEEEQKRMKKDQKSFVE